MHCSVVQQQYSVIVNLAHLTLKVLPRDTFRKKRTRIMKYARGTRPNVGPKTQLLLCLWCGVYLSGFVSSNLGYV